MSRCCNVGKPFKPNTKKNQIYLTDKPKHAWFRESPRDDWSLAHPIIVILQFNFASCRKISHPKKVFFEKFCFSISKFSFIILVRKTVHNRQNHFRTGVIKILNVSSLLKHSLRVTESEIKLSTKKHQKELANAFKIKFKNIKITSSNASNGNWKKLDFEERKRNCVISFQRCCTRIMWSIIIMK